MKRARADKLTGGTGDVNPQVYRISAPLTANVTLAPGGSANLRRRVNLPVPIVRLPESSGMATIMEVLKCRWSWSIDPTPVSGAWSVNFGAYLKTIPSNDTGESIADLTTVVDYIVENQWEQPSVGTAPGGTNIIGYQASELALPILHDLTDGDGHGILVASDNLHLVVDADFLSQVYTGGPNIAFSNTVLQVDCEVIYRFKKVSLVEYIGIVQSQQSAR